MSTTWLQEIELMNKCVGNPVLQRKWYFARIIIFYPPGTSARSQETSVAERTKSNCTSRVTNGANNNTLKKSRVKRQLLQEFIPTQTGNKVQQGSPLDQRAVNTFIFELFIQVSAWFIQATLATSRALSMMGNSSNSNASATVAISARKSSRRTFYFSSQNVHKQIS